MTDQQIISILDTTGHHYFGDIVEGDDWRDFCEQVAEQLQALEKPFPKWESICHGAPVEIRSSEKKYWCTECKEPCIARKKKA